jgi:hypothetical protein
MAKIQKIECSVVDGLVCVQVTYENGDFLSASVPEERFGEGLIDIAATEGDIVALAERLH